MISYTVLAGKLEWDDDGELFESIKYIESFNNLEDAELTLEGWEANFCNEGTWFARMEQHEES